MSRQLEDRELPRAERRCSAVGTCGLEDVTHGTEYGSVGICCAAAIHAGQPPPEQQQLAVLPRQQAFSRCDTCQRWHRPTASTMGEGIRCSTLISPSLRKVRKRVLRAVEQRRADRDDRAAPSARDHRASAQPQVEQAICNTTKSALGLMRRMVLHDTKKNTKMGW